MEKIINLKEFKENKINKTNLSKKENEIEKLILKSSKKEIILNKNSNKNKYGYITGKYGDLRFSVLIMKNDITLDNNLNNLVGEIPVLKNIVEFIVYKSEFDVSGNPMLPSFQTKHFIYFKIVKGEIKNSLYYSDGIRILKKINENFLEK